MSAEILALGEEPEERQEPVGEAAPQMLAPLDLPDAPYVMTPKDVARVLRVSPRTVVEMLGKGEIRSKRINGSKVQRRVLKPWLAEYLEASDD